MFVNSLLDTKFFITFGSGVLLYSFVTHTVKKILLQCRRPRFDPWFGKIPLEKGMATHSSILAWEILLMEHPGGL